MLSLCAALQVGVVTSFDLEGNTDPIWVGRHALTKVLMVLTEVGQPLFIEHNATTAAKELGVLPTIEQLDWDFLSCVHVDTLDSASHSPQGILGIFIEHSITLVFFHLFLLCFKFRHHESSHVGTNGLPLSLVICQIHVDTKVLGKTSLHIKISFHQHIFH